MRSTSDSSRLCQGSSVASMTSRENFGSTATPDQGTREIRLVRGIDLPTEIFSPGSETFYARSLRYMTFLLSRISAG
jgi:hypothetical protein